MKKFFCEKFVLSIGAAAVIAVAAVNVNFGKSVKLPEFLLKNIEALAQYEGGDSNFPYGYDYCLTHDSGNCIPEENCCLFNR